MRRRDKTTGVRDRENSRYADKDAYMPIEARGCESRMHGTEREPLGGWAVRGRKGASSGVSTGVRDRAKGRAADAASTSETRTRWGACSGCGGEERIGGWRGVRASEPEGEAQSDSQAGRPASKEGRQATRQAGS